MSLLDVFSALSPKARSQSERLAEFPSSNLPLQQPVTVYWNDYQVPFIDAATDSDLAFTLGLVHGHLRSGQMVLMKHVALGRLSEMAGPWAINVDHAIRILGFDHAAEATLALMKPEHRAFLDAFVAGLNHQQAHARRRAPELALLGVREEPWRAQDLLAIGRLAGTDINWFMYFSLLGKRQRPGFAEQWRRALAAGGNGTVSFRATPEERVLSDLLTGLSRSGSNSVVVGPGRTVGGHAMIANDPHLGLSLPNVWLLAGMRSPSYHMVGMMVPGLPFLGLGRSPHVAWGGTNMRAASSDLVDVADLPAGDIKQRTEHIGTRFWFDAKRPVRQTPHGPILSDALLSRAGRQGPVALRWVGHDGSDEIGAFLQAAQARNVLEFRAAFAGYGVSGLNVLCADVEGNIGQLMAVTLPVRRHEPRPLVLSRQQATAEWGQRLGPLDLPWALNPPEGFIASANNRPAEAAVPVGFFFSGNDRIERLQALLAANDKVSFASLRSLQTDTVSPQAAALAAGLLAQIDALELPAPELAPLRGWDGQYDASSPLPVLFETLLHHVVHERHGGKPAATDSQWELLSHYLLSDLALLPLERRKQVYQNALKAAAQDAARYPSWGDMHRLVVGHLMQNLPVLGRRFVSADLPASGSRETPMKTAHGLVRERHQARYGSQSRQISDMGDVDANWFVLLGGQDGWLGSANYSDQIALWQARQYIRLPLRLETVKAEFKTVMVLKPD